MKHKETTVQPPSLIQHLEREMNGLTLERIRKLVKNFKELEDQRARNLQTYRAKVQQLDEEKYQLDMKKLREEEKLLLLEKEQYQKLTAAVENYTREVQRLKKTSQKLTEEQFTD